MAIPVSQIVTINPGVIGTGGNPLSLNAVMLTQNALAPYGTLQQFSSAAAVGAYYGTGSTEYANAVVYFAGPDNSSKKPLYLFVTAYATASRAAFNVGSSLAGVSLATIQGISGTLSITIDGTVKSAVSLNLSAASSFSNAATLIGTALSLSGGQACTWNASISSFVITSGTTGATSTITQATGTTAAALGLAAGTLSQGTTANTPAAAMTAIAALSYNWGTFFLNWAAVQADNLAFAAWNNGQNSRYAFIAWDADPTVAVANTSTTTGAQLVANNTDGVIIDWNPLASAIHAAFIAGVAASVDWSATEGRLNLAFRTQSGLAPAVTDGTGQTSTAALSNGYVFYGQYAAPGQGNVYNVLYNGQMAGSKFKWFDTYINQIRLNAQLQLGIFTGLMAVNSDPYNELGNTYLRSWMMTGINEALNNGSIRTGVTLSAAQISQITAQVGKDISNDLFSKGYYIFIGTATAQTRGNRQSPPIAFYYCDGGSIQQITLPSYGTL